MNRKFFQLIICIIWIASVVLPSVSVIATENEPMAVDPQLQLLLDGGSEARIDKKTKRVSLSIGYSPVDLTDQDNQQDCLKLELPKGVHYIVENNQTVNESIVFSDQDRTLEIDLKKVNGLSIVFDLSFADLSDETPIKGQHAINGQIVGTTEEVRIMKEAGPDSDEVEEPQSTTFSDEATEKSLDEATTREARATLDLGIPTTRTLPVPAISDGQFENVSYFDVGTKDEWNAALSVGATATNSGNNNNLTEITYINITDDFALSNSISGNDYATVRTNRSDKKLIVNGNGHTIDFRELTFRFDSTDWDIVFQNLTVYNGNDWGSVDLYNANKKTIVTIHNVVQYGAQAFEGSRGKLIMSGDTSITSTSTNTYTSPIDNAVVTIDSRYKSSANIAVGEVYVKAGSTIAMDNGRYGANVIILSGGNFYTEDGPETNIRIRNLETPSQSGGWEGGTTSDFSPGCITVVSNLSVNAWPDEYRPDSLKGRTNSIYFGDNTHVSIHNGAARRDYATALQNENANGTIELGKNASFTGIVDENTATSGEDKTPVYFSSSGSLILGENASFNLTVGETDDPAKAGGDAMRFYRQGKLDLQKGSSFVLQSATSNTDGMLKMNYSGSSINIADQATFDIGFTRASNDPLFSLNGTLNIPASDSYTHRIRLWENGNFDESSPLSSFQPLDKTTITYSTTTISSKSTALADGFVDNDTVTKFNSDYTSNAQRLVIDPIVFGVKPIDELTNEVKTEYTVSGSAEPPGGKVEVSGGPFDSLPADQRQVLVQADGTYEWKGNLSRPFNWGETIRVSYVGHPDKIAETVVKDVTKPTGVGRTVHVVEGATIPSAKDFIASVEDTNALDTNKDNFDYRFIDGSIDSGGIATITNGQEKQEYSGHVIIDDTRGNTSDSVEVKLVIHQANTMNSITADDLTVRWSDVSGLAVGSTEYGNYLKNSMSAQAQTIVDGNLVDLLSSIEIENLASIPNTVGGPYTVRFVVRADSTNQLGADLVKEVQLTVKSNLVEPRDPSTGDPTDQENEGTGENGELRLDYVPSSFNFGTKEVQWRDTEYQAQGDKDQWIQVADERPAEIGWTLKATATPFTSGADQLSGATLTIPQGELYNKKTAGAANPEGLTSKGEVALSTTASTIFTGEGENSKDQSTYVWKKNQVKLKVPKGQGKAGNVYKAKITWIVEAGVTN